MYLKKNNEPIGNIIYDRYDDKMKSLEIAVNLHPNYWRQGYMTEALLATMEYVFNNLDIDNIMYGYAEENFKSKGLSDKIGFEYYDDYVTHYTRIDKDVRGEDTIMSKERFRELYVFKARK